MENRRRFLRMAIAALFAIVASAGFARNASAQDFKCICDYVTVVTDPDVQCKFEVCVVTGGQRFCDIAIPGQRFRLRCIDGVTIYTFDCHGNRVPINADCKTPQIIAISSTCCVSVCVTRDANDCLVVHFSHVPAPCDKCP